MKRVYHVIPKSWPYLGETTLEFDFGKHQAPTTQTVPLQQHAIRSLPLNILSSENKETWGASL